MCPAAAVATALVSTAAFVTILHSVNAVAEIIVASRKTGERIPRSTWTKIPLSMLASVARPASEIDQLIMGDPTAFYDCKAGRWVLIWTSFADEGSTVTPCLFMAVSHTKDTMGDWTVYALEARPRIPGYRFCEKGGGNFSALAPQVCCIAVTELVLEICMFMHTYRHAHVLALVHSKISSMCLCCKETRRAVAYRSHGPCPG